MVARACSTAWQFPPHLDDVTDPARLKLRFNRQRVGIGLLRFTMLRTLLARGACGRAASGEPSSSAAGLAALLWPAQNAFPSACSRGAHASAAAAQAVTVDVKSKVKAPRAPTAFQLYMKDFGAQVKGDKAGSFMQRASQAFKTLSEQERQRYAEQAAALKVQAREQALKAAADAKALKQANAAARSVRHANLYNQYVKVRPVINSACHVYAALGSQPSAALNN